MPKQASFINSIASLDKIWPNHMKIKKMGLALDLEENPISSITDKMSLNVQLLCLVLGTIKQNHVQHIIGYHNTTNSKAN